MKTEFREFASGGPGGVGGGGWRRRYHFRELELAFF